jgi:hypothetical protein
MHMEVRDTGGQLKSTGQGMYEFAQRLQGLSNDTERLGAVQKVIKGAGAELLPFFKALAEQGKQVAMVTNQQAAEADRYRDSLDVLHHSQEQFYLMISQQVTPVMEAAVIVMTDMREEVDGINTKTAKLQAENKIRQWAVDGMIAVTMVIDGLRYVGAAVEFIGKTVGLVAVYFVEAFKAIGSAIGISSAMLNDFGGLLQGVNMILSGQWVAGAAQVKESWNSLKLGVDQMGMQFGEALTNMSNATETFFEDVKKGAEDFAVGATTEKFLAVWDQLSGAIVKTGEAAAGANGVVTKFKRDSIDGMAVSLAREIAALQANLDSMRKYGVETKATAVAQMEMQLVEMERNGSLAEHARRTKESTDAIKERLLAGAAEKDYLTTVVKLWQDYLAAVKRLREEMGNSVQTVVDQIQRQKDANVTYGAATWQVTQYSISLLEAKKAALLGVEGTEDFVRALELQISKMKELVVLQKDGAYIKDMVSGANQLADAFVNVAQHIAEGQSVAEAFRNVLKDIGKELLALTIRKWTLSILADIVGGTAGSAIATAAGNVGSGTISGLVTSAIGSWFGKTALGQSLIGTSGGMWEGLSMGFQSGVAAPGAGYMETFGAALKGAMPIISYFAIALAGAAVAAHQYAAGWRLSNNNNTSTSLGGIFSGGDSGIPGATWMGSAMDRTYRALGLNDQWAAILSGSSMVQRMFGRRARQGDAYGVTGTIGANSFSGQNWQDWSEQGGWFSSTRRGTENSPFSADQNSMFSAMLSSLSQIVGPLAASLGTTLSQGLAGYSRAFNVQLSNNGDYDPKALQDLFGSVLQEQTAMLLRNAGDTEWADYIAGLTQTGEELQATITEFVATYAGLKALNLKGLDMTALQAWQQGTESIGQTFQRVAMQITQFDDAFMTDAQKMARVQDYVTSAFADMHLTVPKTTQDFYDLVHGLDLSTQAGRDMFDMLMQVAPAFLQVSQAMASAVANFQQVASNLSPGYGSLVGQQGMSSALTSFNQILTRAGGTAWTSAQAMANIQAWMSNPAQMQSALEYAQSIGGAEGVSALTALLQAYGAQLQNASSATQGFSSAITGAGTNMTAVFKDAQKGIVTWLGGLFLNKTLSPYKPNEMFDYAQDQYVELMLKLKKNPKDPKLLNSYTDYAQQYLEAALAMYGSGSQYQQIFAAVTGQAAEFGGLLDKNGHPTTAADTEASTKAIVDAVLAVKTAVGQLATQVKNNSKQQSKDAATTAGALTKGAALVLGGR